jgi:DNA modification methylase
MAAVEAGAKSVPVIWVDVDDETAVRVLLADNRTNDVASYDNAVLAEILSELASGPGLEGTGYDGDDLDALIADLGGEPQKQVPDAPEAQIDRADELRQEWGVERGQLWIAGDHRILCGDSTSEADIASLVGGMAMDVVFTDPPYDFETSGGQFGGNRPAVYDKVKAAGIDSFEPSAFLATLKKYFKPKSCAAFIFCNKDLLLPYLQWAKAESVSATVLVWKRQGVPFGDGHIPDVEYLVYLRRNGVWNDGTDANRSRVLDYSREPRADHPTAKPVGMIANQLLLTSTIGGAVADPFLGSGSTLCACEQIGRHGYGMDIEPKFVAVTLQRLKDMGLEPRLANA